jgi:hypothetical protein
MIGMILLLGLAVLAACALMPREIGREDDPLTNIRLELPDVQRLALRMRAARGATPRQSPRRLVVPPPPAPVAPEGPSAMGAPQPVLSQDQAGLIALP